MSRTILLIDDNDLDNYINRMVMEQCDFSTNIIDFRSPLKALEYLGQHAVIPALIPELIFLDIKMPLMDGFEFLEAFDKLPDLIKQKSKIIMLSSSLYSKDIERSMSSPYVIKFSSKPLTKEELADL